MHNVLRVLRVTQPVVPGFRSQVCKYHTRMLLMFVKLVFSSLMWAPAINVKFSVGETSLSTHELTDVRTC